MQCKLCQNLKTIIDYLRYIEDQKEKFSINADIDYNELFSSENPMFEVYKMMASYTNVESQDRFKIDLTLYKKLKHMITQLVLVEPEQRMKLKCARKKLDELDNFTHSFLLLNPLLQNKNDQFTSIEQTTQNCYGLMDAVGTTRLFTTATGGEKKLTQRTTNLCVSITAMRLLSFELVNFLKSFYDGDGTAWGDLKKKILAYSDDPQEERENAHLPEYAADICVDAPEVFNQGTKPVKRQKNKLFIQNLITICSGVISPKSLSGLNDSKLDDYFQRAFQEQNIGE